MGSKDAAVAPWEKPTPISDVLLAFPAGSDLRALMPDRALAEGELEKMPDAVRWARFQGRWFAGLLPANTPFRAKEGIDARTAARHLSAIQQSFDPKHEHKEAAVAWLASLWLEVPPGEEPTP